MADPVTPAGPVVERLRELLAEAKVEHHRLTAVMGGDPRIWLSYCDSRGEWRRVPPSNAALIVAAVNALPDLLDAADRCSHLEAENERLRGSKEALVRKVKRLEDRVAVLMADPSDLQRYYHAATEARDKARRDCSHLEAALREAREFIAGMQAGVPTGSGELVLERIDAALHPGEPR